MALLSICILFCDKDVNCVSHIIDNISKNCKLNYEIILIDNRLNYSPLNFTDTNSRVHTFVSCGPGQWNGRRTALKCANGDYIWFVDVDDEINEVPVWVGDIFNLHADIIAFNAHDSNGDLTGTWPLRKKEDRAKIISNSNGLLSLDMEVLNGPCVWDKFFKKSVLLPALEYEDAYLTYNEDSLFNMIALKNSKTWISVDKVLYKYNSQDSQAATKNLTDINKFKNLISSGQTLFMLRDKIFTSAEDIEATYSWINKEMCVQFLNTRIFYSSADIQVEEMSLLFKVYEPDFIKMCISKHAICELNKSGKSKEDVVDTLLSIWYEAISLQHKNEKNNSLAICFNFCDKDFKYVRSLIKNIRENVKLEKYEIILCDNRTKDNGKDEYIEGVKVWPCGGNTGPLGGRKEACKHITSDYVWFIDADDFLNAEIGENEQRILNKNYDYVSFKAIDDSGKISGIWADTALYNNKEINNDDGCFFSYRTYLMTGAALWNKWIKTEVFKCILDIPDTTAVCYEDALCNSYIMKHSKRMFLYNMPLYYYRNNIGDANRQNIQELESFKRTTNGGRTSLDIAKKIFTEKELFIMDAWFSDLRYIEFSLKRIVDSVEKIQKDELLDILKYFKADDINTAFLYFTWYFPKSEVEKTYKKFQQIAHLSTQKINEKPLISISIAFCDKDIQRIHKLLWSIQTKMKGINYEIILINNCQHNNRYIPMMNNIRVISTGSTPTENKGTFYTRKIGLSQAKGKYIWFIDADDDIYEIGEKEKEILDKDYDFIVFDATFNTFRLFPTISYTHEFTDKSLLSNKFYNEAGPCLWNKWIKIEKLKDIFKCSNFAINAFEDVIVNGVAEKNSTKALFYSKILYKYIALDNTTCAQNISSEGIKKIFLGKDEIHSLIQELFTPAEISNFYAFSSAYAENFFSSRLEKVGVIQKQRLCIISTSDNNINGIPSFSINSPLSKIEEFQYVLTNICNTRLSKNLNIEKFGNLCFQNCTTLNSQNLLKYNFLVKVDDFLKAIRGTSIKVEKNTINKL